MLMKLRSPYIVLFIGCCTKPPNICLVTEFMEGGSLFDLVQMRRYELDYPTIKKYAIDIATGMNYLHLNKPQVLHRDLKSLNILLDRTQSNCKIADFGMSRMSAEDTTMTLGVGTPIWMAPELMRREEKYTEKVDIYSYGLMLWEMVANDVPFKELNQMQLLMEVAVNNKRPPIPANCDPLVGQLIQDCWQKDPTKRPSFQEILDRLWAMP